MNRTLLITCAAFVLALSAQAAHADGMEPGIDLNGPALDGQRVEMPGGQRPIGGGAVVPVAAQVEDRVY